MSILPQAEPTLPTPSPRIGDWIHTLRGPFWPLDPRPEEIHVEVIARGLSCETRFAGQGGFYSVAQHVVHVVELLESWGEDRLTRLWGLHHDDPEGLGLKDIPRPVKRHLGPAYAAAESRQMEAVCIRFGLPYELRNGLVVMPEAVRRADEILLCTEARDLLGVECIERWDSLQGIEPHPMQIAPWSPEQAERRFLAMFAELTGGQG